jgi:hypothetical protein
MNTVCTFIEAESAPNLKRYIYSCTRIPWNPIKVKYCGINGTKESLKEKAEQEVDELESPPKDNLINYCNT